MEAEEILTRAKEGPIVPAGWAVFPLLRDKVLIGLFGWALGIIMGLGLFALVANIVIPVNYQHGFFPALITTLLLGVFLFVGFGSAWTLWSDIRRLRAADKHLIVITQEDFVKQEGAKITHVPLVNVRHVTARGLPPTEPDEAEEQSSRLPPKPGEGTLGFLLGRGFTSSGKRRKRMRTPTSLAFIDTRGDNEVVVVDDVSFGNPHEIAAVLKEHAAWIQQPIR